MNTYQKYNGACRLQTQLSAARRILMLPHVGGEAADIRAAFAEIHLGLSALCQIDRELIAKDTYAANYMAKLQALQNKKELTPDEQAELSHIVDDLEALLDIMLREQDKIARRR